MQRLLRPIRALSAIALFGAATAGVWATEDPFTSPIGMNATIEELILPGTELEVKPLRDDPPIVLRITKAFRHGSAFRYHLVYYGLEPGDYNLADYLQRRDGSAVDDLPAINVSIREVLPPGQVKPNALKVPQTPIIGGYGLLLGAGAVVWLIGLFLLFRANAKRSAVGRVERDPRPKSLADRLRPLVEAAANGSLNDEQRADLERLLLAYWRRKLNVQHLPPAEAIAALKADSEAGELLRQLEQWLHHPAPDTSVDVASLLEPYRLVASGEATNPT